MAQKPLLIIPKFDDKTIGEEVKRITGGGASGVNICTAWTRAYAQGLSFLKFQGTMISMGIPSIRRSASNRRSISVYSTIVTRELRVASSAVGIQKKLLRFLIWQRARGVLKIRYRLQTTDWRSWISRQQSSKNSFLIWSRKCMIL